MADNRMYLCCLTCSKDEHIEVADCVRPLAKYYHSTGWYIRDDSQPLIDKFLTKHNHHFNDGQDIIIIYEDIRFAENWRDIVRTLTAPVNQEMWDRVERAIEEGKRRVEEKEGPTCTTT